MRCVIVSLLVILGVFTFETGVHAVHHLGHIDEPETGCALAAAGAQVDFASGVDVVPPLLTLVLLAVLAGPAPVRVSVRASSLPPERAPPLPPAA